MPISSPQAFAPVILAFDMGILTDGLRRASEGI
jgi:hypothetical protein